MQDFQHYEGNAQGFRILCRLFAPHRRGGMRPTLALCGVVSKYTCNSGQLDSEVPWTKKNGHFIDDQQSAIEAFDRLGLGNHRKPAQRHPLAFLTEAADDIAYHVVDLEDAYKIGEISFKDTQELLAAISCGHPGFKDDSSAPDDARIERFRAGAITELVRSCAEVFVNRLKEIERGSFKTSLLKASKYAKETKRLVTETRKCGYESRRVLLIEAAGFVALGGLLDKFGGAALSLEQDPAQERIWKLLPAQFNMRPESADSNKLKVPDEEKRYIRLLAATDYISGMTDSFAVDLYQKLSGIRLPS